MTEPREPEFPQPEATPTAPAASWPPPPSSIPSFPPPPAAVPPAPGAVPPLPPLPDFGFAAPAAPEVPGLVSDPFDAAGVESDAVGAPSAPAPVWSDPAPAVTPEPVVAEVPAEYDIVPAAPVESAPAWNAPTSSVSAWETPGAAGGPVVTETPAAESVAVPPTPAWSLPSEPAPTAPVVAVWGDSVPMASDPVPSEPVRVWGAPVEPVTPSVPSWTETAPAAEPDVAETAPIEVAAPTRAWSEPIMPAAESSVADEVAAEPVEVAPTWGESVASAVTEAEPVAAVASWWSLPSEPSVVEEVPAQADAEGLQEWREPVAAAEPVSGDEPAESVEEASQEVASYQLPIEATVAEPVSSWTEPAMREPASADEPVVEPSMAQPDDAVAAAAPTLPVAPVWIAQQAPESGLIGGIADDNEPVTGEIEAITDEAAPVAELDSPHAPAAVVSEVVEAAPPVVLPILPAAPVWTPPPAPIVQASPDVSAAPAMPTLAAEGTPLPEAPQPEVPSADTVAPIPVPDVAAPAAAWAAPEVGAATIVDNGDIFRTAPIDAAAAAAAVTEEERRLAAERAARRDARSAAFASDAPTAIAEPVAAVPAAPVAVAGPVRIKRTTDGFFASFGLFWFRLVMAAIFGLRGAQMLLNPAATQAYFAEHTILPMPGLMGMITGGASVLIAVALILGLATRAAGLGMLLIGAGALVLAFWGPWSLLDPSGFGVLGETQLLAAAAGLVLLFVGAGGWSLDRTLRAGRERDKAERAEN